MHEEVLRANNVKISDGSIAETTFISRIFGGKLCNELKCNQCQYTSKTYNSFHDISLEVTGSKINSLKSALDAFSVTETLTNGNEWKCDGCNKKVKATKRLTISTPPQVLIIHLKRFSYRLGKIEKQIGFDTTLELPCHDNGSRAKYELSGVIVHHGRSAHSGHYVAYVKVIYYIDLVKTICVNCFFL